MWTQYAIVESDDTQLYISCETRSGLRPYWTACKCLEMHVLSVCDVLLQMVTDFCLCCSVAVGCSCDVQLQLCPSPPSVFKQLLSTLELPGHLSGLPVPGLNWSLHCQKNNCCLLLLSNLGNNFGVGVVSHHSDPPNLASAGAKTPRDFNQVVLHGVPAHRHEVDALGYLDRVHRRQPEMEPIGKRGKGDDQRTWLLDPGQTFRGQAQRDQPAVCQLQVCVASSSSQDPPRPPWLDPRAARTWC